jgi:hypothetical protein
MIEKSLIEKSLDILPGMLENCYGSEKPTNGVSPASVRQENH